MEKITTEELRKELSTVLGKVNYNNEIYSVTKNGKQVAIICSEKYLEDIADTTLAKERLEKNEPRVSWERKEQLELDNNELLVAFNFPNLETKEKFELELNDILSSISNDENAKRKLMAKPANLHLTGLGDSIRQNNTKI